MGNYKKDVKGRSEIDVYDVLELFGVTCPARQHAIKKLLCAGERGTKGSLQDLREARKSVERAIELEEERLTIHPRNLAEGWPPGFVRPCRC